jgi:hypothetical protein
MENNTEQNEPHNMNLDDLLKTLEALNPKEKEVILPKDDLLNILLNLTRKKPEIPEGFMNAEQWAKKWNRHVSEVRRLLQKGVETGLLGGLDEAGEGVGDTDGGGGFGKGICRGRGIGGL